MFAHVRRILAGWLIGLMVACSPDGQSHLQKDSDIDTRPERISASAKGWLSHEGGIAKRGGGLIVDIASGGTLRRDVLREVSAGGKIDLVMTVDAHGDQTLRIRMAGGCARDPIASEHQEDIRLKPGYNRVTMSNQFKEQHTCFIVEFWAISGPVSLTIEDASLYWRD